MTPTAKIYFQQSIAYLESLEHTILIRPGDLKTVKISKLSSFNPASFMGKAAYLDQVYAVGLFDDENREHIIAFEKIGSLQKCINYLYTSSHVIHREWYMLQSEQ
ncbi:MAG: hypothetical protein JSR58_07055 [Verrucomicrobia bacterium]|nr:hypothetical protein [Verrucomicrobiota bacterium]